MSQFATVCFMFFLTFVSGEVDELAIQYIADVVSQSQEEVFANTLPDNAYQYKAANQTPTGYGTFDYIIVGAGSAGTVLATRLSENKNLRILLLEAGGRTNTFGNIPGMYIFQQGTKLNWNFKSVPQTTCCLGMVNQQCSIPRGKGLGGSSLINGLMYVRASKYDHDSWENGGNRGWSYRDVLPFYIKSENSQIDGDDNYHGKGGLLNVEYHRPYSPPVYAFLEANKELGRKVLDYNGREQIGAGFTQYNTINGQRDHTGRAFLAKADNRANLRIVPHSYVTKVVINKNKQAQGVLFDHKGQAYYANATKEVILAAGAFGSPQLLMLSGVGPSDQLKALNIPVINNLPVGKNYQDHATFWALFITVNYTAPVESIYQKSRDYLNDYGPYTAAGGQSIAFLRTKSSRTPRDVPNIEIILEPQNFTNDFEQRAYNYDNETYDSHWTRYNPRITIRTVVILLKPQSRGTVKLNSSSPYDYPLIDAKYLSDKNGEDIEQIYEGINAVREMINTTAFKKLDAKLLYDVLPQCANYTYDSKEQWFCQIRTLTSHVYHPVGTCKMAPYQRNGVVDNELKVYGIDKLRVIDASIIPDAINGHTHAPSVMIAEKMIRSLNK